MQPTYLPWLGYFDLISSVDVFILLDTVQFSRRSWQQRNRIRGPEGLRWLTVPVASSGRTNRICDAEIGGDYAADHVKNLEHCYARAPFKDDVIPSVAEQLADHGPGTRLSDLTGGLIGWHCECLQLSTPRHLSSSLPVSGSRSELLIEILRYFGASTYLSPPGSAGYLLEDAGLFQSAGIDVVIQSFRHPVYRQLYEPFCSHAAAVDAAMNVGWSATRDLIATGHSDPVPIEAASEAGLISLGP